MKPEPLTKEKRIVIDQDLLSGKIEIWQHETGDAYWVEDVKSAVQWLLEEIEKEIDNPPEEFKQDPYIDVADFILGLKEARFLIKKAFSGVIEE